MVSYISMKILEKLVFDCHCALTNDWRSRLLNHVQVKVAEHILTGHKVAIKILNRKKIKQMDMEEKGKTEL